MIVNQSARSAFTVTPGQPFAKGECMRLYVGSAGNVTVTLDNGESVVYANVPAGTYLYVRATGVSAATASNIVAETY